MCHGQVIWSSVQRARKLHHCEFCGDAIKQGRAYSKLAIRGDADEGMWTQKTCARCYGRIALVRDDADDGDGCLVDEVEPLARDFAKNDGWRRALAKFRAARDELLKRLRRAACDEQEKPCSTS